MKTDAQLALLALAALLFLLAALIPGTHPAAAYRLHIVAGGLLAWVLTVLLLTAKVL